MTDRSLHGATRTIVALLLTLPLFGNATAPLWESPVSEPMRVIAHFDLPNGPYNAGHRGIDIAARAGQAVHAPTAGVVSFAGVVVDRPVLTIRVDEFTFVSIEPLSSDLEAGDTVRGGQHIGEVASGAHCTNACLHLGVRVNDEYVNPLRYFVRRPVLLPW